MTSNTNTVEGGGGGGCVTSLVKYANTRRNGFI